jgi:NAD(P)-dependent dehydrogenase (short-subunit alcohol dehydrogenase family)
MTALAGKVIVVTGGESGIGRACVLACAAAGAAVVAAGLQPDGLQETLRLANTERVRSFVCDVRDAARVESLFAEAVAAFGSLSACVANAGVIGSQQSLVELEPATFRAMIETNLVGAFLTVQAAARVLIRQGRGGSIIATGSSSVLRPAPKLAAYAASKGGVHAMMQAIAVELAPHRIRVNTLVPGTTATDATRALPGYLDKVAAGLPLGEVVTTAELGAYVAFVLSDAVPHMTGSLLKLDSGRTIG